MVSFAPSEEPALRPFKLCLIGPFLLTGTSGEMIEISSKKIVCCSRCWHWLQVAA